MGSIVKTFCFVTAVLLVLGGCKSEAPSGGDAAGTEKPKIYTLDDVDKELKEAGVQLNSAREDLRNFRKAHPNYQVCQDTDYMFVARMRNSKIDAHVSDQYIVAAFDKDGKIANLEVGPPEFSVGNLPSYCH
jgi:hypothetical protein